MGRKSEGEKIASKNSFFLLFLFSFFLSFSSPLSISLSLSFSVSPQSFLIRGNNKQTALYTVYNALLCESTNHRKKKEKSRNQRERERKIKEREKNQREREREKEIINLRGGLDNQTLERKSQEERMGVILESEREGDGRMREREDGRERERNKDGERKRNEDGERKRNEDGERKRNEDGENDDGKRGSEKNFERVFMRKKWKELIGKNKDEERRKRKMSFFFFLSLFFISLLFLSLFLSLSSRPILLPKKYVLQQERCVYSKYLSHSEPNQGSIHP